MQILFRSAVVGLALCGLFRAAIADDPAQKPAPAPAKPAQTAAQPVPEMKFNALLLWGTNGEKPPEAGDLKELDPACKAKLEKVPFKWKDIYQVGEPHAFSIKPGAAAKRIRLSDKCEIAVEHKDGLNVELFGEGKSVQKVKHAMPLTEWLVVGGNDKGMNAWFVVVKPE
jgi:hypothetical protein